MNVPPKDGCWGCRHQQITSRTLLGHCLWPVAANTGPAREIPPHVVDRGCPKWEPMTPGQEKARP